MMKEGDILLTCDGEVEVTSLERKDAETVSINGGVEEGGIDLVTNDGGFFYAVVLNDAICWYEVGEATIRVSVDFEYHDMSDLQKGDVVYYAGSFLNGEVTDYNFTPFNTTIRLEEGQIVEMIRVFVP